MTEKKLLEHRDFVLLWISGLLVVIGSSAFPIALAVTVLDAGGTATTLGLILASRVLASVILSLAGGVWADRYKRKYIMISADVLRAVLTVILVFVTVTDLPTWTIALVVFLMGAGEALGFPASGAILPSILPDRLLPEGNAWRAVTARVGAILGPALGGAMVALIGSEWTFLVTAVFFVVGTALLIPIQENDFVRTLTENTFVRELREGLIAVRRMPWVMWIIIMAGVQLMVVVGAEVVLLPVVTREEFGGNFVFAAASVAAGLGGGIAALIWAKIKVPRPGLWSVLSWMLFSTSLLVLVFPVHPWLVIGVYFIVGLSTEPFGVYWPTAIQREVPRELQARVFSVDHMGSLALMPLGMALVGPITEWVGMKEFLIFAAGFHIITCLAVLMVPGVIDLKTPKDSSQGEQDQPAVAK
ncbi:MAG: MFS transporter [Candidatus Nanopelagicaceae bacterium]